LNDKSDDSSIAVQSHGMRKNETDAPKEGKCSQEP
jgi:hypothetical protein